MEPISIGGAWTFTPAVHRDDRGYFLEWFRAGELSSSLGYWPETAQANCSVSRRGVIRGIHFSDVPPGQAKYVSCVQGAILDVVVDIRVGSPSYGRWEAVRLDDESRQALFISEGLGHAFTALSDQATVIYLCSTPYAPGREHGVNPLDPAIGIRWPADAEPVLSGKDAAAPTLAQARAAGLLPDYRDCEAYLDGLRKQREGSIQALLSGRRSGLPRGQDAGKGAVQRRPPIADRRDARPGPGTVTKHAVRGPWRRAGKGAARYGPHPGRIGTEQVEDLAGQPVPGRLPAAGGVVDAGPGRRADQRDDLPGHVGGPGGLAALVVHHVDRGPLVGEPDHRLDEVWPVRPVQPRRPDDITRPGQAAEHRTLASQLGPPVGGPRRRDVVLGVRPAGIPGENVVGGDLHQAGP
jgi:dTDP-4-dehydrorhamnose 3,5-epimerase